MGRYFVFIFGLIFFELDFFFYRKFLIYFFYRKNMKKIDQIAGFLQLTKIISKYKSIPRPHSHKYNQCSVVSILKFSETFLSLNPAITKKIQNSSKSSNSFTKILEEELDHLKSMKSVQRENIFDILYIQRTEQKGDRHSGQVAFPGGRVDPGEDDVSGGIREVYEEIGLDLNKNSVFLGKLPRNWFAYTKRKQKLKISLLFFFSFANIDQYSFDKKNQNFFTENSNFKNPLLPENLILSQEEVQSVWWTPYSFLFLKQKKDIFFPATYYKIKSILLYSMLHPSVKTSISSELLKKIKTSEVSMRTYFMILPKVQKPLWGITLFLSGSMVQMSRVEGEMEEKLLESSNWFV